MAKEVILTIPFSARLELYILKIKIGHPFKSKLRIAIEGIPELFRKGRDKCLIA